MTPQEEQQLRRALDALWAEMTPAQVHDLRRDNPETVEICRANHQILWHPAFKGGR